jgi:IgA Peptidase M64
LDYSIDHKIQKYYPGRVNEFFMYGKVGDTFEKSLSLTLTHELGHAIFNLSDEYSESGRSLPITRFPNCAPDTSTAKTWWSDLEGKTDPYIKEVFEIQNSRTVFESSIVYNPLTYTYEDYVQEYLNIYKVGYYKGGCFAEYNAAETQTRPLTASMMSNQYYNPFFGLVNSREINKVFNLFSGTAQIVSKPLPINFPTNNFEFTNESIFEKANCKVKLLENSKKTLRCEFKTKLGRTISESPEFSLKIVDYNLNYIGGKVALSESSCKVENKVVTCSDLDISTLDLSKKTNLVWKFESGNSYIYTDNMSLDVDTNSQYNKLTDFPTIDKAKPTIKITDPYACGGKITGNVTDNLGFANIKSVTVQLTKTGETTPKYTFNPVIDTLGNYSIPVQQTDRNDSTTFVEAGEYKVTYFATDKSDNVSESGSYLANIKSKEACEVKPAPPIIAAASPFVTNVLVRSGGLQIINIVLFAIFVAGVGFFISRKKIK